jgi:hypothetical protein
MGSKTKVWEGVRCLSVPQEALLLLEFLDFLFIGGLSDKLVDVGEVAFSWDIESSILLSDAIAPP